MWGALGDPGKAWGAEIQWTVCGIKWNPAGGPDVMLRPSDLEGGLGLEIIEWAQEYVLWRQHSGLGLEVWVQGHCRAHMGTEWGSGLTADVGKCVPGRSGW